MVSGPIVYDPVGRCIYCGSARHSARRTKLGDEHIIPEGLGGTLVLPQASCGRCEGLTGSAEQFCQKQMLGVLRYKLGPFTKRPKERPRSLPVDFLIDGKWQTRDVPIDQYPMVLFIPIFLMPGLLTPDDQRAHYAPLRHFTWNMSPGASRAALLKQHGATHIRTEVKARVDRWGRMLAKIAHSYATAYYGHGKFRPFLLEVIDKTSVDPTMFVGGNEYGFSVRDNLHEVKIGSAVDISYNKLIIVQVQLFASFGLPTYYCVAGHR
jgi:hypothetical protein